MKIRDCKAKVKAKGMQSSGWAIFWAENGVQLLCARMVWKIGNWSSVSKFKSLLDISCNGQVHAALSLCQLGLQGIFLLLQLADCIQAAPLLLIAQLQRLKLVLQLRYLLTHLCQPVHADLQQHA